MPGEILKLFIVINVHHGVTLQTHTCFDLLPVHDLQEELGRLGTVEWQFVQEDVDLLNGNSRG